MIEAARRRSISADARSSSSTTARAIDTARVAAEAGARVVRHPHNMGNGAAVKSGLREARGRIVVLMDADGQHHPEPHPGAVSPIRDFEMVVGARSVRDTRAGTAPSANEIYNRFASYVTEYPHPRPHLGLPRHASHALPCASSSLLPNTFSYPTTLTMAFLHSGLPVKYVPIPFRPRVGRSKIRLLDDGLRFFLIITRIATLYSPLRVFLPVGTFFFFTRRGLLPLHLRHRAPLHELWPASCSSAPSSSS